LFIFFGHSTVHFNLGVGLYAVSFLTLEVETLEIPKLKKDVVSIPNAIGGKFKDNINFLSKT